MALATDEHPVPYTTRPCVQVKLALAPNGVLLARRGMSGLDALAAVPGLRLWNAGTAKITGLDRSMFFVKEGTVAAFVKE